MTTPLLLWLLQYAWQNMLKAYPLAHSSGPLLALLILITYQNQKQVWQIISRIIMAPILRFSGYKFQHFPSYMSHPSKLTFVLETVSESLSAAAALLSAQTQMSQGEPCQSVQQNARVEVFPHLAIYNVATVPFLKTAIPEMSIPHQHSKTVLGH